MHHINELMEILHEYFPWNKARLTCLIRILTALFTVRTVNFTEIACAFGGNAKQSSRYRRIQRFFCDFEMDYQQIARFIYKLFSFDRGKWYLTMDRTNWQWGQKNINVLMLAIVYKGIAIPISWKMLDKKGNSNTEERIELIRKFIGYFGKACIAGLLADREFIGKKWFAWLIKEEIPFYIRIKNNAITTNSRGLEVDVDGLFYDLKVGQQRVLAGKRRLWGHDVYLTGTLRTPSGELLIVSTNSLPERAIQNYAKRWEIETLFGCLKGRGFNFEDTHVTEPERIKKLTALLAIAFCWAHKTGEWLHKEVEPIKIKTHGRPAKSLFRYGLDFIREAIFKVFYQFELFKECLVHITPPGNNKRQFAG